ncbi:arylsulfatase, partial [bacterium]|nr:arylsulfatase [bacterium]
MLFLNLYFCFTVSGIKAQETHNISHVNPMIGTGGNGRVAPVACVLFTLSSVALNIHKNKNPEKPNILILFVDDMGYGDPECYNSASLIPTPNINSLANQGVMFTDAHSPSAVCSPTRYGLLTGRYSWRTRLKKGVIQPYGKPLIKEDRITLPKFLKEEGYITACIGKWHLGFEWGAADENSNKKYVEERPYGSFDVSKPIGGGPLKAGFDYYFGLDLPSSPLCYIENNEITGPIPEIRMPAGMYGGGGTGLMQKDFVQEQMQPILTNKTVEYINQYGANKPDKPFFLYASFVSPHAPIVPTKKFKGKTEAMPYGDYVHQTDYHIGEIIQALKKNNLTENTIVIFTSDNGSPSRSGAGEYQSGPIGSVQDQSNHNPSYHWRGRKGDIWEGGHRVPFIVRWPEKFPKGEICSELICLTDIYASLSALLNRKMREDEGDDSFNILPLFFNPKQGNIREDLVLHSLDGVFAIRKGDWKMIPDELGSGSVYSQPQSKKPG